MLLVVYSLDTTKGGESCCMTVTVTVANYKRTSVMSGVITGPHFVKFFGGPNAIAVGSMVAVLEIGAFGQPGSCPINAVLIL